MPACLACITKLFGKFNTPSLGLMVFSCVGIVYSI